MIAVFHGLDIDRDYSFAGDGVNDIV